MTIGNALIFIKRGSEDSALRDRLNTASGSSELLNILADENLTFSAHDFDEAFHHQLTRCQEAEEADQLREFRMWWELLSRSFEPISCGKQCAGCGA